MARFVHNPNFQAHLQLAVMKELDNKAKDVATRAKRYIEPYSSTSARAIHTKRATIDAAGPKARVEMGRGLGRIFEYSKQSNRRTSAGANRGVFRRREFFNKAIDEVVREGLDLNRYL